MAKRIGMVASRCCWVADGGAVLLGNVIRGFHGGGGVIGEWHCRFEWWLPGVAGLRMVALCYWRM